MTDKTLTREQVEEILTHYRDDAQPKYSDEVAAAAKMLLAAFDAQQTQIEALDGVADMADTCMKAERIRNAKLRADNTALREKVPLPAVKMALLVLVNHIEPGFENCTAVVQAYLDGKLTTKELP